MWGWRDIIHVNHQNTRQKFWSPYFVLISFFFINVFSLSAPDCHPGTLSAFTRHLLGASRMWQLLLSCYIRQFKIFVGNRIKSNLFWVRYFWTSWLLGIFKACMKMYIMNNHGWYSTQTNNSSVHNYWNTLIIQTIYFVALLFQVWPLAPVFQNAGSVVSVSSLHTSPDPMPPEYAFGLGFRHFPKDLSGSFHEGMMFRKPYLSVGPGRNGMFHKNKFPLFLLWKLGTCQVVQSACHALSSDAKQS